MSQAFGSLDICHEEYQVREDLFTRRLLLGLMGTEIQSNHSKLQVYQIGSMVFVTMKVIKRSPNWNGGSKIISVFTRGEGLGEGTVREMGTDVYTLLYLKWIASKDLPYNTGTLLHVE